MPFSYIFLVLLAIPLLEIAVFILIGGQIGVWPTLALIFVTAIIGSILLRKQGFSLLAKIRQELDRGHMPARDLVRGVMVLAAGLLLLTPGFVTDTIGFLLFVPSLQSAAWRLLESRMHWHVQETRFYDVRTETDSKIIDLDPNEFAEENPSSPWHDTSDKQK